MGEHHPHDKGYKELYSNKSVFLDLLRNVLRLDWARDVEPDDLTLTDKSYVTGVFTELESDLVYRMKLAEPAGKASWRAGWKANAKFFARLQNRE